MNEALDSLARHGSLILFFAVFVDQIGLPLPSVPFLLAAGALAGAGRLNWAVIVAVAGLGSLIADTIWFFMGRIQGIRVLKLLCRISLEPDTCVRRTEDIFSRFGMKGVVVGKFIPGLSTVMPPLAGIFKIRLPRFLAYDGFASLLYAGTYVLLGVAFSNQLQPLLDALGQLGFRAVLLVLGVLAIYIGLKYLQRQRVIRELRIARITVDDLRKMQEANEGVFIVDLRSELAVKEDPDLILGAIHLSPKDVASRHLEIPRDRDIVLYCSCPNEETSARAALLLRKRGIRRVRPLLGGLDAWRERNYPVSSNSVAAHKPAVA
jgi:membrane protein DedA with SNARE-associated domain/rhodanese-related sulfurtransferase